MIEIRRGVPEEFEEIIDLLNFVFSKNSRPHDFEQMYPNIYVKRPEEMHALINLWENGRIRASVLSWPRMISVCGREMGVYGIGSVATHPRDRGKGYMTMLMDRALADMRAEGAVLSNLGGRRSRYNHFGYENSGNQYRVEFDPSSVKANYSGPLPFTFQRFTQEDAALTAQVKAVYESKAVHYKYTDWQFVMRTFSQGGSHPYAVLDAQGVVQGYIVLSNEGGSAGVWELVTADDAQFIPALFSFIIKHNTSLSCTLGEWQLPLVRPFQHFSRGVSYGGAGMWNILDFGRAFDAYFAFKATYAQLEEGTLVIDIRDCGRYALTYKNGTASVETTAAQADISLGKLEATYAFFGAAPCAILGTAYPLHTLRLIRSWFPLPLTWLDTERV